MSIDQAKKYIRRLRAEVPLRRQFELVWQGKRRDPDKIYRTSGKPVVPHVLAASIPDSKTDPEGYRRWWALQRAQQDMHDLLFSKGEGRDHAQRYVDDLMVTGERITEVMNEPEMEASLDLLARIANATTDASIDLDDMKAAWHGFVRWVFHTTEYSARNDEVRRLRDAAAKDPALRDRVNGPVASSGMSAGAAIAIQNYLETGFAAEDAYEKLDSHKAWMEEVAAAAREAGYDFSVLDYVRDCISKQREDDPGPDLDDRYWPEDDPNKWNYEPPPVFFTF